MSNALLEYLNKRLDNKDFYSRKRKNPGPLITLSREVGCNGVALAQKLAIRLNKRHLGQEWKVLSKEVFFHSAKELNMEPDKVKRVFKYSESYTLNEILNAFGNKKFKSERKVIRTVNEVIHSFAEEGFCIIVGRAAHIIAQDIHNALHVRLVAPCDHRIKSIMEKNHLNFEEAVDFINRVEKERKEFRKAIGKDATEDFLFDLFLNRATFNDDKTIDLIEFAAEKKEIFKDYNLPVDYL